VLVSVITTCFNGAGEIKKTIESVLEQDFTDFEYIIMDGGSKDDTLSIAKSYEDSFREKGIEYKIFSQPDSGIYDGMNHGVAHATGEFINFMNADDIFHDAHVLSAIFTEESNDIALEETDIIYGDCIQEEYDRKYLFPKDFSEIKKRMPFSHQSVFARRSLLEKYPFDTKYKIAADYDFLLNCYDNGAVFCDSKIKVCTVTLDGVSSFKILDCFVETDEMLRTHGIVRYSEGEYKKKLGFMKVKQIGMNCFPSGLKKIIRRLQRKNRGQDNEAS